MFIVRWYLNELGMRRSYANAILTIEIFFFRKNYANALIRPATKRLVNVPARSRTNSSVARISTRITRPDWNTTANCTTWITSRCRTDPALSSPPTGRCWTMENHLASSSRTSASVSLTYVFFFLSISLLKLSM